MNSQDLISVHSHEISDSQNLLALLPSSKSVAWVRGGDGLVGWGEFKRLEVSGSDRFEQKIGRAHV